MPYHSIRDPDQIQALLDAVLDIESDLELSAVLLRIVEAACSLTDARYGAMGVVDASGVGLSEFIQVGMSDEQVAALEHLPIGEGILGLLILDPRPLRLADLSAHPDSVGFPPGHPPMTSFLGVPLRIRDEVFGNLYLTDRGGTGEFSAEDEGLIVALAAAAGIAVHNARLHLRLGELSLATDRERIARDLHDTVIQRMFATGLSLQSVLPTIHDVELYNRVAEAISDLDDTIRQVRTTIFALDPPVPPSVGIRNRVIELCSRVSGSLGFEPEVRFAGAIDGRIDEVISTELLSTLREGLSNVVRHADATHVEVVLTADDDICLRVSDDGVGVDPEADRSGPKGRGLANMAERGTALGGSLTVSPRSGGGTDLVWTVPSAH